MSDSLQDRRNRNQLIDSQRRIAKALERIATAMEAQNESKIIEEEVAPDDVKAMTGSERYVLGEYVKRLNAAGFRVTRKQG